MKIIKKLALIMLLVATLVSCKDENYYSLDYYWITTATVENPDQRSAFYFRLDNNTSMFTAASNLHHYYRPKDGQRIIANYTILNDKPAGSSYNHDIRLNDVYTILTKDIYNLTPETQDSIGNDPIQIIQMRRGRDFLDIEFKFHGLNKVHFINLVSDNSKVYNDGKVHLEFRHNAYNDMPTYTKRGIASFNLKPLQEAAVGVDKLDLVIHVKESETTEKQYDITYQFADTTQVSYRNKGNQDIKSLQAEIY